MNNYFESQIAPWTAETRRLAKEKPSARRIRHQKLSPEQKKLGETVAKNWRTWSRSSAGRSQMKVMQSGKLRQITDTLQNIITSQYFQETIDLIEKIREVFPIKAFSIGLNFEAEIIIGFSGTIGVAVNPTKITDASAFLSLGIDEGVEAGAIGGVQFGFWTSAPEDLGGWSISGEVLIDDEIVGATAGAYFSFGGSFQGMTVTVGAGLEDGVEIQESYTFILGKGDLGIAPVYQHPAKHFAIMTRIKAKNIAAGDGSHNEIYMRFKPDDRNYFPYPSYDYFAMAEGDEWKCGRSVRFDQKFKVKLYDADDGGDDDLGDITIDLSKLERGEEVRFSIKSSHGFDDRDFHLYVKLID